MRREWIARGVLLVLVGAAAAIPLGGWWMRSRSPILHARMAEDGGWTPSNLRVEAGKPLRLRLTSDDVVHGFAVGKSDQPAVDVIPGEISEVILTFAEPGKYVYYCTRWCSVNHWRMRGTIEVTGEEGALEPVIPPLYITLGVDIDAEHHADGLPSQRPSAERGAGLGAAIPSDYYQRSYYLSHSPSELWYELRTESKLASFNDQSLWDLVALVWQANITSQELSQGRQLYSANCAACHGETGAGDGVFADDLAPPEAGNDSLVTGSEMALSPAAFSNPTHMLAASPAHLQGKILRGGMGTGMPYWGPIFTEEQTWALVAYLWTFQFELEANDGTK